MDKIIVSRAKWNELKELRGVPDEVFFSSELEEKLLFHKGILRNSDSDSNKALKQMYESIKTGKFVLRSVAFSYAPVDKCFKRLNVLR